MKNGAPTAIQGLSKPPRADRLEPEQLDCRGSDRLHLAADPPLGILSTIGSAARVLEVFLDESAIDGHYLIRVTPG